MKRINRFAQVIRCTSVLLPVVAFATPAAGPTPAALAPDSDGIRARLTEVLTSQP